MLNSRYSASHKGIVDSNLYTSAHVVDTLPLYTVLHPGYTSSDINIVIAGGNIKVGASLDVGGEIGFARSACTGDFSTVSVGASRAVGVKVGLLEGLDIGEPGNVSLIVFLAVPLPRLFKRPMNPLLPPGVFNVGVVKTLEGPLHAEKSPVSDSAVLPVD